MPTTRAAARGRHLTQDSKVQHLVARSLFRKNSVPEVPVPIRLLFQAFESGGHFFASLCTRTRCLEPLFGRLVVHFAGKESDERRSLTATNYPLRQVRRSLAARGRLLVHALSLPALKGRPTGTLWLRDRDKKRAKLPHKSSAARTSEVPRAQAAGQPHRMPGRPHKWSDARTSGRTRAQIVGTRAQTLRFVAQSQG